MDYSGAARNLYLCALIYYAFLWNHTVDTSIGDGNFSPYTFATGRANDISCITAFQFNEPVYCLQDQYQQNFPSESKEIRGRWVGISEHVGAPMTWKILTDKTQKIIFRSKIRSALDPMSRNLCIDPLSASDYRKLTAPPAIDDSPTSPTANAPVPLPTASKPAEVVFFRNHGESTDDTDPPSSLKEKFCSVMKDENGNDCRDDNGNLLYQLGPHPNDLPGQYFHMPHPETGLPSHITIGKLIDNYEDALGKDKTRQAHFEIKFSKDEKEDIMS